jgi:ribosomal protein S18 acetylase RimI-like enzyme
MNKQPAKQGLIMKEIRRINNPGPLSEIIYKNFLELSDTPSLQHSREEIQRLLTNPEFIGFFVYDGQKVVAYLTGEKKHLNDGRIVYYITYIFVGGKYRNHKIGSRLMEILIGKCEQWGISFIMLTCDITDNKVINFYKKLGFTPDPILKNGTQHEVYSLYV